MFFTRPLLQAAKKVTRQERHGVHQTRWPSENRPPLVLPAFPFIPTHVHTSFKHTTRHLPPCRVFQQALSIAKQLNLWLNTVFLSLKAMRTCPRLKRLSTMVRSRNLLSKPKKSLSSLARWKNGSLGSLLKSLSPRVNGCTAVADKSKRLESLFFHI